MINRYKVGAVGKRVSIANLAPQPELTPREALELAAWLTATAAPLMHGDPAAVLGQLLKMVAEVGDDDVREAALKELAE